MVGQVHIYQQDTGAKVVVKSGSMTLQNQIVPYTAHNFVGQIGKIVEDPLSKGYDLSIHAGDKGKSDAGIKFRKLEAEFR